MRVLESPEKLLYHPSRKFEELGSKNIRRFGYFGGKGIMEESGVGSLNSF